MRNAASFTPIPGTSQSVNLIYNQGYFEVINLSPYKLQLNIIGGGTIVEEGAKVLFSNSEGGNNFQINPIGTIKQNNVGNVLTTSLFPTISSNVLCIVNEYNESEIAADAYPASIGLLAVPSVPFPVQKSFEISASTTTTVTALETASFYLNRQSGIVATTQLVYLLGFDFYGYARSTQMNHRVLIFGVYLPDASPTANQYEWNVSSTTSQGPCLSIRFPTPVPAQGSQVAIGATVDVLDNTLRYCLNFYGCVQ